MKLYIIRHGETDLNKAHLLQGQVDIPLNETGRWEAREAASHILKWGWQFDMAYSSPLGRALETCQIVVRGSQQKTLGKDDIITDPRLKEINFGVNERMPFDLTRFVPGSMTDTLHYNVPQGGESFQQVVARTGDFLQELCRTKPGENILIAAHGGAIRCMLISIGALDLEHFWGHRIGNCGIHVLELRGGRLELTRMIQGVVL